MGFLIFPTADVPGIVRGHRRYETTTAVAARNVGLVGTPFGLGTRLFNNRTTPGANDVCIGTGHSELDGNRLDRAAGQVSSDYPDSGFGARRGGARDRRQFDRGCSYECTDCGIDRYSLAIWAVITDPAFFLRFRHWPSGWRSRR